ncbi:DUF4136 domain-containing protein [Croceicoccus sp. YJ47]|uniref:DUF4136 domain-containing protein n=1 Tax=Croceicoccus sp. YJ47 TaxID=2798724 RepID=UPI001F3F08FC|nr:DUF4136 domain-containing protein [Croceicoccus sp. YJ47]
MTFRAFTPGTLPMLALALVAPAMLGACATTPPVDVTRFSAPERLNLADRGTVEIVTPDMPGGSLMLEPWRAAVAAELAEAGYTPTNRADSAQVAEIFVRRDTMRPERRRGPVSVGVGGSTGGYGSGVGVGVGIDLSGPPPEQVSNELSVVIRDRASGESVWEGRADQYVEAKSGLADAATAAQRLAAALFADFPGEPSETYTVKD